jgi:hypothetical protein
MSEVKGFKGIEKETFEKLVEGYDPDKLDEESKSIIDEKQEKVLGGSANKKM